ncbi:hypothetical protein HDU78_001979 [Chytriomyces hyalinus]|nr:hypothetical protein HDU78_001979 [Chytriomyces hyalinus]KAJ3266993.1 hypothetical protein HDU77_008338 [Chytriomyces hyalinus]
MNKSQVLAQLQTELTAAIAAKATPAALRMHQALDHQRLDVSLLSDEHVKAVASFVCSNFADEPLGVSCGRTPENYKDNGEQLAGFIELVGAMDRATSIVVTAGNAVVAVALCDAHLNPSTESYDAVVDPSRVFATVGDRIEASFVVMDHLALPALTAKGVSLNKCLEWAIGVTDSTYRGSLAGAAVGSSDAGVTKATLSIFQRLSLAANQLAKLEGYAGIYTHSHDGSAARQAECGFEVIHSIPYNQLPKNIAVTPVEGRNMMFMYQSLQ